MSSHKSLAQYSKHWPNLSSQIKEPALHFYRNNSRWRTFCTLLKDRKRTQLPPAVRPKCSRAPIAVLNCKSFHTRSSNLNGKGSDYATPLDKPKYRAGQGWKNGKTSKRIWALGRQILLLPSVWWTCRKFLAVYRTVKSSTNIYKYKVPGTQPSQAVLQFKVLKLFIYHHLAHWMTPQLQCPELGQRWGLRHKGKIKSKSVYSKNFWTPAQIAEASKVILSPCQPVFHSSALTPSSLKQELNKPGLKASSQPVWKLWTFLCTEELVL